MSKKTPLTDSASENIEKLLTVYTKDWCGYCDMAKAKFDSLENVQDFVDYKRLQVSPQNLDECTMAGTVSAERPDDTGQYVNAGSGSLGGGYLQAGVAKRKAMSGI